MVAVAANANNAGLRAPRQRMRASEPSVVEPCERDEIIASIGEPNWPRRRVPSTLDSRSCVSEIELSLNDHRWFRGGVRLGASIKLGLSR